MALELAPGTVELAPIDGPVHRPWGHAAHVPLELAPVALEYRPAEHFVHSHTSALDHDPGAHCSQDPAEVVPNDPAAQLLGYWHRR
jgi:hypothetical protein